MVLGIAGTQLMDKLFANQTVDIGVESTKFFLDPTVDISVAIEATLTLIIAGTLAGFFPARKATKIRPIEALRAE
jgi:putative ABC transport system permease protein